MAQKIAFELSLDGFKAALNNTQQLKKEIKGLKEAIKDTNNPQQLKELNKQLDQQKALLKEVTKTQRAAADTVTKEGVFGTKSVKGLKARLKELKNEFEGIDRSTKEGAKQSRALAKQIRRIEKDVRKAKKQTSLFRFSLRDLAKGFAVFAIADKVVAMGKAVVDFVDETNNMRQQVAQNFNIAGESLDNLTGKIKGTADAFELDGAQISDTARLIAEEFGISASDAVDKLGEALASSSDKGKALSTITDGLGKVSAQGKNLDESLAILTDASNKGIAGADVVSNIGKLEESLDGLAESAGSAGQNANELLASQKELADAQVDIAKRFEETSGAVQSFVNRAGAFLIRVGGSFLDALQPVFDLVGNLIGAFRSLGESLGLVGGQFSVFDALSGVFKVLSVPLQLAVRALTFFVTAIRDTINETPILRAGLDAVGATFSGLIELANNLGATFAGLSAGARQAGTNILNFFQGLLLDVQILGRRIASANPFGDEEAQQAEIDRLRARRATLAREGRGIGEAFTEAYNEARQQAVVAETEAQEAELKELNRGEKKKAAARKKASAQRKKAEDQRKKDREKELAEIRKNEEARVALIAELNKRLNKAIIDNIDDEFKQRRVSIRAGLADEKAQRQAQLDDIISDANTRREAIKTQFGAGSEELKQFERKEAEDLRIIRENIRKLDTQAELKAQRELKQVTKDETSDRNSQLREDLEKRIGILDASLELELLKVEERGARGLITEQQAEAKSRDLLIQSLRDKLTLLQQQEDALNAKASLGIKIPESEYNAIVKQRQALNTQIAKLEKQASDNAIAEAQRVADEQEKLAGERRSRIADAITGGLENLNQGLALIKDFSRTADEARLQSLNDDIEAQTASITALDEQLQTATGNQKKFLEQQKRNEVQQLQEVEREKEAVEKARARREKAIAISTAIINGALAITKILAEVPKFDFGIATAIQVGLATATTAAQVGAIASQKFERGGLLKGRRHSQGGIHIEAEDGEAVINRKSVGMFLPALDAINRAGGGAPLMPTSKRMFATGGLATGLSAPVPSSVTSGQRLAEDSAVFTEVLQENILRTNERIDNLRVTFVQDDKNEFDDNQKTVQNQQTF